MRVGATEPPRVNGAMWLETNASGVPLQSWEWVWNVDRWLSPEQFWTVNIDDATSGRHFFPIFAQRIRLRLLQADVLIFGVHNNDNCYEFDFGRTNAFANYTGIASLKTVGGRSEAWNSFRLSINQTINAPAVQISDRLVFYHSSKGSAGTIAGSATLVYQFER